MAESYATQLERVEKAIAAIEERGVSHSAEGRSMTRADLATLYDERKYLRKMVARAATGGGITIRGGTPVDG